MRSSPPSFSVWLRRVDPPEGPFVLRYEVRGGKGAVRMAHPGVIIDPPFRTRGDEPGLSPVDLRAARFLHAPGHGARSLYSLARLEPAQLAAMPKGEWVMLELGSDGGVGCLTLPRAGAVHEAGELDMPTIPFRVLSDLRVDTEPAPARPAAVPSVRAPDTTGPTEHGDDVVAVALVGVGEASRADLPTAATATPPASPVAAAPAAPAAVPDPASPTAGALSEWPALALHHRSTTAIRHLRRVVIDLEVRNRVLEARLTRGGSGES